MNKPRLKEKYTKEIVPQLQSKFGYKNSMSVPHISKIVVNMGVGEAVDDIKLLDVAMADLATITGQKPIKRRAKKAVSNFKIKQGHPVGLKVTLRRARMYEFLDRLINIALPRIRDFRGLSQNSFDEAGNYSFGIAEQLIFPEIEYDKIEFSQGMNVTICITAKAKEEARELLRLFGMPFQTQGKAS
ncbi:MAG: 50S ribosomal protein L5 [Candidatus Omnitrophica bacterium]|nr:50S ribosomal protein L5 [Candidatus Omnitrophota bacterium]